MQKFISVKVSSLKVKDAIGNDSYDAKAERGIERIQSVKDSAEQVNTTLFPERFLNQLSGFHTNPPRVHNFHL